MKPPLGRHAGAAAAVASVVWARSGGGTGSVLVYKKRKTAKYLKSLRALGQFQAEFGQNVTEFGQ